MEVRVGNEALQNTIVVALTSEGAEKDQQAYGRG
jgi:hypothetical protein